jgi:NuA3 HAT complex component NTO1
MAPKPSTPRRQPTGRKRGRPPGTTNAARAAREAALSAAAASEPPPKRRRYIPGGAGGGGRFVDADGTEVDDGSILATVSAPRSRAVADAQSGANGASPTTYPRRERSTRNRTAPSRDLADEMRYSSAAAVAAAVVQSEGYKPREERGWEEFHPNLDIEATFMIMNAEDIDGIAVPGQDTPTAPDFGTPFNGTSTPSREVKAASTGNTPNPHATSAIVATPPKRRVGRPTRDSVGFYSFQTSDLFTTPKTPKILPIKHQTPKEKLDLKKPSYRQTNRILLFESKTFGQARYVDKSMMNVGYQESDNFIRPDQRLIKATDANMEEDIEQAPSAATDVDVVSHTAGIVGRVEYDMDSQDDVWLQTYNVQRKVNELELITREIFEITITKIEKEWHALEKRIPKPNPKPPQTHRPRSSSAAAVNGEPQVGEEQDSKCAICDDGDCENTNAIVFCDGCDLAVHQECYGVPFIPEGQWLCRKCQLIGRGIPVRSYPSPTRPLADTPPPSPLRLFLYGLYSIAS